MTIAVQFVLILLHFSAGNKNINTAILPVLRSDECFLPAKKSRMCNKINNPFLV